MNGWIKLHRQITEWRWYSDANTFRLFVHLLLKATRKPVEWCEIELLPGQLITGRKALAEDLKLSEQEIRTAIEKLKKGKEITIKATNKFSVITVCKWDEYQSNESDEQPTIPPTEQPTINQQSTNNQPHTRSKELKNKENTNNPYSEWRNDFKIYEKWVMDEMTKISADPDWIKQQQKFNPNLDIPLTLEKAVVNFWGTAAGWKNKIKSKSKDIDWKATLTNAISQSSNKVYKPLIGTKQASTGRPGQILQPDETRAEELLNIFNQKTATA